MARCRKCGIDVFRGKNICPGCLAEFTAMRKTAMKHIEKKYGKFSPQNLTISQKEMRRLTDIWRRDPLKFEMEVNQERGMRDDNQAMD
jgi:uncharacterized membrane protein YvbJ